MDRRRTKSRGRAQPASDGGTVVPLVEEQVQAGKREVEVGRVRIVRRTRRRTEQVDLPLEATRVAVRRVPVGAPVPDGTVPQARWEGETLVVPVVEERLVVQRQLWVREELRVTRERRVTRHRETVELRSDDVDVERVPAPGARRAGSRSPSLQRGVEKA